MESIWLKREKVVREARGRDTRWETRGQERLCNSHRKASGNQPRPVSDDRAGCEVGYWDIIRNTYVVFFPRSWHRAPKTLVISYVPGVIGGSFVTTLGLCPSSWHRAPRSLGILWVTGDRSTICSNEATLGGPLDSFRIGAACQKDLILTRRSELQIETAYQTFGKTNTKKNPTQTELSETSNTII